MITCSSQCFPTMLKEDQENQEGRDGPHQEGLPVASGVVPCHEPNSYKLLMLEGKSLSEGGYCG